MDDDIRAMRKRTGGPGRAVVEPLEGPHGVGNVAGGENVRDNALAMITTTVITLLFHGRHCICVVGVSW